MKTKKGMTVKRSIILHCIQQLSALIAFSCTFLVVFFSFIRVINMNSDGIEERTVYHLKNYSDEKKFEDTETFDEMLIKSIKEIIRYNVAKSQLETDGVFDGKKLIDIEAFVNRKNNDYLKLDNQNSTFSYTLEDLIKWDKYGVEYETITIPEYEFVTFFGKDLLKYYDGNVTKEQADTINNLLSRTSFGESSFRVNIGSNTFSDSKSNNQTSTQIRKDSYYLTKTDEAIKAEESFIIESTDESYDIRTLDAYDINKYHQILSDIIKQTNLIQAVYYDADQREMMVCADLINERYLPDNCSIMDYVTDWFEYAYKVENLVRAIDDIAYNYQEYLSFHNRYNSNVSNFKYSFKMTMMGKAVEVQNLSRDINDSLMDTYFKQNFGKYMIYRPDNMFFESNTGFKNENMLFNILANYEYAYPETAQIWIAVDTKYPVQDAFSMAAGIYSFMHPIIIPVFSIGICAMIVWLMLFLYLSSLTGYIQKKREDSTTIHLYWFDSIPTELMAGLGLGIAILIIYLVYQYFMELGYYIITLSVGKRFWFSVFLGLCGMFISLLTCLFWYSLCRRVKAHTMWKDSILRKIFYGVIIKIFKGIKKVALHLYDNSTIWIRGFLYLGTVIIINFGMGFIYGHEFYDTRLIILLTVAIIIMDCIVIYLWMRNRLKRKKIVEGIKRIRDGELDYQIELTNMHGDNRQLAEAVNSIGNGIKSAVETSMKDERLKADLITNVSHDIKTPLTSIINYVSLLKRENIEEEPFKGYIDVLESKSQRLKQLTEDLLEASKISSGNITLYMEKINLIELINQSIGEFSEKFDEKHLEIVDGYSMHSAYIEADSRRIWRVIENLFNNIYKYALNGTRVYIDLEQMAEEDSLLLSVKNISMQPLNIKADELTERFIRGDVSRSTEGSGLGLSIAKNLTQLQHGKFQIYLDGDLFKVTLIFPNYKDKEKVDV